MTHMYPDEIVTPCRAELTDLGFRELKTPDDVSAVLDDKSGTTLVVVNSVCGCAAGGARPAVRLALKHAAKPDRITTVFAGVDADATAKARSYMAGYSPSSPSMALFKDGRLVHVIERHQIEGRHPEEIARELKLAFDTHCAGKN
jgi:putative YphP/YqiW family bacilliredoxin